jgi:hypothetical protein
MSAEPTSSSTRPRPSAAGGNAAATDAAVGQSGPNDVLCLRADEASTACDAARQIAFGRAICSCGDVIGTGMLSVLDASAAGRADVAAAGSLALRIARRGDVDEAPGQIDGTLLIAGLGPAAISGVDASIRGDLSLGGELTFAGNVHVAGSVYARRLPRGSGMLQIDGDLHHSMDFVPNMLASNVQVGGEVIDADYATTAACACNTTNLSSLANTVAAAETDQGQLNTSFARDAMSNLTAAASFELGCGKYYFESVSSLSTIAWHISGHVTVIVADDFAVGGDVTVTLAEGAQLDVLIGGSLLVGGEARFGDTARAAASRVYVLGAVELATVAERAPRPTAGASSAETTFVGNLYAPTAMLQLAPHTELYGSLFVRQLLVLQSLLVHYEPAVTSLAGVRCEP